MSSQPNLKKPTRPQSLMNLHEPVAGLVFTLPGDTA